MAFSGYKSKSEKGPDTKGGTKKTVESTRGRRRKEITQGNGKIQEEQRETRKRKQRKGDPEQEGGKNERTHRSEQAEDRRKRGGKTGEKPVEGVTIVLAISSTRLFVNNT